MAAERREQQEQRTAREQAWVAVEALGRRPGAAAIRPLFAADPRRFARFSHRAGDLLVDLSKTSVSDTVLAALLDLARACEVESRRDAMARGEPVNATERRAVLHMALRAPRSAGFVARRRAEDGAAAEDASAAVHDTLDRMRAFVAAVHEGAIRGATGERLTDVVNIGIGGSDLGPAMAARALWREGASPMRAHYLAKVDAHAWEALRPRLDPARTLVLVASKTFTTQETMLNARLLRAWLAEALGEADAVRLHMAALSTNLDATA
jgi:glucose-6-phosphate isomerase